MSKDTREGGSRRFSKNPKKSCFSSLVASLIMALAVQWRGDQMSFWPWLYKEEAIRGDYGPGRIVERRSDVFPSLAV